MLGGSRLIELSEVIEDHLGRGHRGERGGDVVAAAETAEQAMAHAALGDGAELLLHGFQQLARPVRVAPREDHREDRGEPPDGARQVDVVEQLLAPVPLEIDEDRTIARPARESLDERAQQHVVDLRPVDPGHVAQEVLGVLGAERHRDRLRRGFVVAPGLEIDRQAPDAAAILRAPVFDLRLRDPALGVLDQALGPALERGRLPRQDDRGVARAGLGVPAPEIFEHHPPRDAVDREVVHREEQARRSPGPEIEVRDADHRPLFEIEAGLRLGARALDRRAALRRGDAGEIDDPQRNGPTRRREDLLEARLAVMEPQAERVVVLDHRGDRALEQRRIEPLGELDQEGLVPVVRALDRQRRPPPLDRRERRRAGDRALLGVDDDAPLRRDLGELGDRLVLKHLPRRDHQAGLLRSGNHLDREDRVAAAGEEVVVDADLLAPEHRAPDPRQLLFDRRARRDERLAERGLGALLRRRQRGPVDLAVGGERQRALHHERGRDHVLRQRVLEERAELQHRRRGAALAREIGHEALLPGDVFARQDRDFSHRRVPREGRLDLAELDAIAADLHLMIDAPEVLEHPGGQVSREITGPVQA